MKITRKQLRRIIKEVHADYKGLPQSDIDYYELADDYGMWVKANGHATPAASSVMASYFLEKGLEGDHDKHDMLGKAFRVSHSDIMADIRRQQSERSALKESIRRMIREASADEPIRQIPGDSFSPKALKDQKRRFGDYSKKTSNSYKTVITMSPEGDSVLVDGIETYIDDVPQQLEILSGFPMEGNDPDNLIFALEEMWRDGYIELAVSYEDGRWGW